MTQHGWVCDGVERSSALICGEAMITRDSGCLILNMSQSGFGGLVESVWQPHKLAY